MEGGEGGAGRDSVLFAIRTPGKGSDRYWVKPDLVRTSEWRKVLPFSWAKKSRCCEVRWEEGNVMLFIHLESRRRMLGNVKIFLQRSWEIGCIRNIDHFILLTSRVFSSLLSFGVIFCQPWKILRENIIHFFNW